MKLGVQIAIGPQSPQNASLVKFKMAAIYIKFDMPMQSSMPMTIRKSISKSKVEFQYGRYGTDTTFYRMHF